jgi:hypothetical protein
MRRGATACDCCVAASGECGVRHACHTVAEASFVQATSASRAGTSLGIMLSPGDGVKGGCEGVVKAGSHHSCSVCVRSL